jgi:hypothetical protein
LSAAQDGDTVLVAPGEYVVIEPLTFEGKRLQLVAETGWNDTTLALAKNGWTSPDRTSVLVFEQSEPAGSLVKGFTIRGGRGNLSDVSCHGDFVGQDKFGGGVLVLKGAQVAFEDCLFLDNASNGGAGLCCYGGTVVLRNCVLTGNTAWDSNPGGGGGLSCLGGGEAVLENCEVTGNHAQWGGGLMVCGSKLTMMGGRVTGNSAGEYSSGGGISCGDSDLFLDGCTIASNDCLICSDGGGIAIAGESFADIRNCIIERHSAEATGGNIIVASGAIAHIQGSIIREGLSRDSGGIACFFGAKIIIDSSILFGNGSSAATGGLYLERSSGLLRNSLVIANAEVGACAKDRSTLEVVNCTFADNCGTGLACIGCDELTVRNSIFWRNGANIRCDEGGGISYTRWSKVTVTYSLLQGPPIWPGEGNITGVDPLFGDAPDFEVENYRLRAGSPAIDAGTSDGILDRDFDGKARLCGPRVDLGPFEFGDCEPKRFRRGDVDGSGSPELTDAVEILGYLFQGTANPTCLDAADTNDDGQINVADAIHELTYLFLGGPALP